MEISENYELNKVKQESSISKFIVEFKDKLLKIEELNEETINNKYINLEDSKINILSSYTTRLNWFLDILLRWKIISSKEIHNNIWDLINVDNHRWWYFWNNDTISLSTWFVSFKYFDKRIENRESFNWWTWFFLDLNSILNQSNLDFSHCSSIWWIEEYNLNKNNILNATHIARKNWELYDDWYWNLFEILLKKYENKFPEIDIKNTIIAIPYNMKDNLIMLLKERQEFYKNLLNEAETEKEKSFIKWYIWNINIDDLTIYWYKEKNLEIAMKNLSIK